MRVWIGPLLALIAVASYFTVFVRWPATRDVPWVSYGLLALALVASTHALVGAVRARRRVVFAALADVVTTGLAGLFVWYCLAFSVLPEVPNALAVGATMPPIVLVDDHGAQVDLSALAHEKLLLVFYRGHW